MSPPEPTCAGPGPGAVVCDLSGLTGADIGTVDVLAQLGLATRLRGGRLELRGVCPQLQELLVLAGLDDVLAIVEVVGQPEQREQLGAKEVGDRGDPAL